MFKNNTIIDSIVGENTNIAFANVRLGDHSCIGGYEYIKERGEFVEGKCNVLVCTTTLESGIDIPNANTIIVENADKCAIIYLTKWAFVG